MKPIIPKGGFFAAKYRKQNLDDLEHRLKESGAQTLTLHDKGLVLGVWKEFPGQGLWFDKNALVVYDLDLTNEAELLKIVDLSHSEKPDTGYLLWSLYRKFGLDFLDRLRGAFGFALWDGEKDNLLVATDPYGIKPVVYSHRSGGLIAASRIKHIFLAPDISREIDPEAIYHYLFFQAICSPVSIYKDIRKLESGKAIYLQNDSLKEFVHYDIRYQPDTALSESHWIKTIQQELEKAVNVYVPLSTPEKTGCFLSGGTDSSSVIGYYRKLTGRPAKTFSIGFNEAKYNELDYAHIASHHFGTEQNDYYVTPLDVLNLIDALPRIYDEPFANASVVPAYYCASMARESGVEVLLGGDGGDEIFGGNERYVTNLVFERYFLLPRALRTLLLEPLLEKFPDVGPIYKASRYIRRANMRNPARFFSYNLLAETDPSEIFQPEYLAKLDTNCFINLAKSHYDLAAPAHDTDRLLYIDMKFTITDNDLRKVTQMVEAAGVRVRYPFLDRDLVDFTATIPPTLKVKPGKNRYIFKQAMEGFLPHEIIKKTKHGMGLPIALWFKKDSRLLELLNNTLFRSVPLITEYVRPEFINKMKSAFEADSTSYYGDNLWVLLMLELWLQKG
ncbi:MAG: asparagine synthase-related protein [Deltaproteobacteria bacterium]|nr:asparagine synthase-related protein [Deltaproteobacteria bacterium]